MNRGGVTRGKALFLCLGCGSFTGGMLTLFGGARDHLAIELLRERYNVTIDFTQRIRSVYPVPCAVLGLLSVLVLWVFPPRISDIRAATQVIEAKVRSLGRLYSAEKRVLGFLLGTIVGWVHLSTRLGLAPMAILGGSNHFVLRAIEWHDVEESVSWDIVSMYAGAIALASALETTGAAHWRVYRLLTWADLKLFRPVTLVATLLLLVT